MPKSNIINRNVYLYPKQNDWFEKTAKKKGISVSLLIRMMADEFMIKEAVKRELNK